MSAGACLQFNASFGSDGRCINCLESEVPSVPDFSTLGSGTRKVVAARLKLALSGAVRSRECQPVTRFVYFLCTSRKYQTYTTWRIGLLHSIPLSFSLCLTFLRQSFTSTSSSRLSLLHHPGAGGLFYPVFHARITLPNDTAPHEYKVTT